MVWSEIPGSICSEIPGSTSAKWVALFRPFYPVENTFKPIKDFSREIGGLTGAFKIVGGVATAVFKNIGEAVSNLVQGDFKKALQDIKEISSDSQAAVQAQIKAVAKAQLDELKLLRKAEEEFDVRQRKERLSSLINEKENIVKIEKAKGKEVAELELELFELRKKLYKADSDEYKNIEVEKTLFLIEENKRRIEAQNATDQEALDKLKDAAEETKKLLGSGLGEFIELPQEKLVDERLQKFGDLLAKKYEKLLPALQQKIKPLLEDDSENPSLISGLFGFNDEDDLETKLEQASITILSYYDQIAQAVTASLDRQIAQGERRLQQLTDSQTQSLERISQLEQKADKAKGERRNQILQQIDSERRKEAALAKERIKQVQQIEEAERKKAIANKVRAIAQSVINTAVSITEALPNLILAGIVGALGGIQTGVISAQKFQDGGLLKGPSHKQGGIPILNKKSGNMVEAEGNEYFVNRLATANNLDILSRINQEGKRKRFKLKEFENGGLNSPDFSSINSALSSNQSPQTAQKLSVNVGFNEFERTGNRVKEIKQTAKL
jgi:hypothetical protein